MATKQQYAVAAPPAWRRLPAPLTATALAILAVAASVAAATAQGDGSLLATERWREHSYGVSLRPPLGSRLLSRTADDAVVRIYGREGYTIRLYIKKSTIDLDIQDLVPQAIHQLGGAYPSATILEQKQIESSGLPGAVIYFRIPDRKRGAWVMAQAFVGLNTRAFVMLQLEVDAGQFNSIRPTFEAVLDSLEAQDPKDLDRLRAEQIEAGRAWREPLSARHLHKAIQPEQWLRITGKDADIGYMHIQQKTATEMGQRGVQVDIRSRIHLGDKSYDSISNFFVSDDNAHEFWSIRATVRTRNQPRGSPQASSSWAETGVRSNDKITVSLEKPTGIEEHHWQRPLQGYLSQVELHMFDQLAAGHRDSKEMGFYAYYPRQQKLVYRTTQVESAPGGSFTIRTRPSPDQEQQVSHYDAQGRLVKRLLPEGRLILPATKQELALKWRLK